MMSLEQYTHKHAPTGAEWGWRDAIHHAADAGWILNKYSDPVECARSGLTMEEALEVVSEDPNLIYLTW
jgi:hypothetical protein